MTIIVFYGGGGRLQIAQRLCLAFSGYNTRRISLRNMNTQSHETILPTVKFSNHVHHLRG